MIDALTETWVFDSTCTLSVEGYPGYVGNYPRCQGQFYSREPITVSVAA